MTGEDLKKWREAQGMTQTELADALGVAGNTVARWERDERTIPAFLPLALETVRRERNPQSRKSAKRR